MNKETRQKWQGGIAGACVCGALFFLLPKEVGYEARMTLAVTGLGVVLWIAETFPIGQTSFLLLLLISMTGVVPLEAALSGFASGAIFLIIAGMMLARAVNDTLLIQRLTYYVLMKVGSSTSRILGGILMISQVQALFIPATAVRTSLLLPAIIHVMKTFDYQAHPNIRRQFMLGVAFGGNISGTAILPILIGIASKAGADPVVIAFTAALTSLFGFILGSYRPAVTSGSANSFCQASGLRWLPLSLRC